jgi:crooked neck
LREERVLLLEAWRDLEKRLPRSAQMAEQMAGLTEVTKLMPKKVKKRRLITGSAEDEGGDDGEGWEEYYDYQFPDDQTAPMNLKILEMARMWKQTGAIPAVPPAPPVPDAVGAAEPDEEGDVLEAGGGGGDVTAVEEEGSAAKKRKVADEAEIDIDDE